jgi:Histidine kinase-, DNA gyrase B-, and HSP90-like ATPase
MSWPSNVGPPLARPDTGTGIDPPLLERVFELFTQGDTTRARVAGGLSIGLTVARHLVELHGGTIQARSAGRGRGSSFEVRLPRAVGVPITSSSRSTRTRSSSSYANRDQPRRIAAAPAWPPPDAAMPTTPMATPSPSRKGASFTTAVRASPPGSV